ncbi:MAG: hypothetical protein KatS3mg103_0974 [Phycisphaerales bacterium]|nr:MAG: hypothetical protein KatS3mg103_0974 [Phycisphaerales bacterium]
MLAGWSGPARRADRADGPRPLVLLGGGVVTGAMLYLGTASAGVFWHVLLLTALVAGASLSHQDTPATTFAAVIAWHAGVAGSLMRWASHVSWASRRGLCPRCGEDVQGVSNARCPACRSPLLGHVTVGLLAQPDGRTPPSVRRRAA